MSATPLPRFRLDRELGTGTSGRVWHGVLLEESGGAPAGTELAVKYLHPRLENDAAALDAFETEARAGLAARHPGLVEVLGSGRDAKGHCLLMRFVEGRSLREVLREEGALPEPRVRSIGKQIAGALAALHAAGYLHGDLKPENIRLDAQGHAVLLDLGFARAIEAGGSVVRRGPAPGAGSLPYLSPEQARGEPASLASDVFALGVVLYEIATGLHPFALRAREGTPASPHPLLEGSGSSGAVARAALERPDADRLLAAIATARITAPSRHVPQLSPFLDRLLEVVLARDPERRPTSVELAEQLTSQESGEWWRSELHFEATERRGGSGETDARHLTPLVGREREIRALFSAYDCAVRGRPLEELDPQPDSRPASPRAYLGGAVWIEGAAGTGKSRLVHEFASRARTSDDPPLYLYARCRELDEERPCHPILRLLEKYLRLPARTAPRERERALLGRLVPPRVAETLAQALDPEYEGTSPISIPVALAVWLVALGREISLVVFLDDLHWAREGTLEVLTLAAEKLAGTRTLLVSARRSAVTPHAGDALARLSGRLEAEVPLWRIELGQLNEAAVTELVEQLFHHTAPKLRLARVLWQRSRGNPAHLVEILRGLLARGEARVHPEGAGLVLAIPPDELPLPPSLSQAIQESYRRLSLSERTWLRRLSVAGGRIETEFLKRAFAPRHSAEVDAVLAQLVRAGWLVPVGARYRFARPALREAVYRGLSREQRVKLHGAAADALRPEPGVVAGFEDSFQRAFHLRASGRHEELLDCLQGLLPRLLRAGQPQRIHSLASWGLDSLEHLPHTRETDQQRIELLEAAVDAADRLGFRAGQRELLDQLSELEFDPDTDPVAVGRVYMLHGRYAVSTGQFGLARGMLRNAVQLFGRSDHLELQSEALRRLAQVQAHVGEMAEARSLALEALEASQADAQRALAHNALGVIDVLGDELESALEHADHALALLRRDRGYQMPGAHAASYLLRARVYRIAGSAGRALASAGRAVRLAEVAGERRLLAEAIARLGGLLLDIDRPAEAESRIREALRLSEEIEDRRGQALSRMFLGILLWEQADPDALATLEGVSELASAIGLNRIAAVSFALQARVHREAGALARAEELAARAVGLLERFGAELHDRIVISGTQALLLTTLGRDSEAERIAGRLRERIESDAAHMRSPLFKLRYTRAAERLVTAVLSPEGPVWPRAHLERPDNAP
ncbi:MAG: protein kinase [Planctomycetes bacterium]|nr:protein kinase [Planctomycetota bacterium]